MTSDGNEPSSNRMGGDEEESRCYALQRRDLLKAAGISALAATGLPQVSAAQSTPGEELWRFETGDWVVSSPSVVNGTVYVGSYDANLYAVDAGVSGSSEGSRVNLGTLGHHHVWAEEQSGESGDNEERTTIEDWRDLDAIRDDLDGEYVLTTDLDADRPGYSELVGNPDGGWNPIGSESDPFTGTLDGNGNEIADLNINRSGVSDVGLFGETDGGRIATLSLTDIDVTDDRSVGTLVGWGTHTTIVNINVTGSVNGNGSVGGLVGGGTVIEITNSHTAVEISGGPSGGGFGGLCGDIIESDVSNSYATGRVNGDDGVGGLVGFMTHGSSVTKSYATGRVIGSGQVGALVGSSDSQITKSYATGWVRGQDEVGGLVGLIVNSGSVSKSYAVGAVEGEKNVGGLVGRLEIGNVSDSYATGSVEGEESAGGLVGTLAPGFVKRSYAAGLVEGNNNVGGFVGRVELGPSSLTESYWDVPATGQQESDGAGTGLGTLDEEPPTEKMTDDEAEENMDGLNFQETWETVVNPDDYPDLQWVEAPSDEVPVASTRTTREATGSEEYTTSVKSPVTVQVTDPTGSGYKYHWRVVDKPDGSNPGLLHGQNHKEIELDNKENGEGETANKSRREEKPHAALRPDKPTDDNELFTIYFLTLVVR